MPLLARDVPELQGGGEASTLVLQPRCGLRPFLGDALAAPGTGPSPAGSWIGPAAAGLVELRPRGTFQVPVEGHGGRGRGERAAARPGCVSAASASREPRVRGSKWAALERSSPKWAKLARSWRRSGCPGMGRGVTARASCTAPGPPRVPASEKRVLLPGWGTARPTPRGAIPPSPDCWIPWDAPGPQRPSLLLRGQSPCIGPRF